MLAWIGGDMSGFRSKRNSKRSSECAFAIAAALLLHDSRATAADVPTFEVEMSQAKQAMLNDPKSALDHARRARDVVSRMSGQAARPLDVLATRWLEIAALNRLNEDAKAASFVAQATSDAHAYARDTKLEGDINIASGSVLAAVGRVQEALSDFHTAFQIFRKINLPRSQAMALQRIGSIYLAARDYEHEFKYYRESNEIFPNDLSLNISTHNNLALGYKGMGRFGDAVLEFEKAYEVARNLQSPFLQAQILNNIASCLVALGRFSDAETTVSRALKLTSQAEAAEERPYLIGELAVVSLKRGDAARARPLIEEAFKGVDLATSGPAYLDFHRAAVDIYTRLGQDHLAMLHLKAVKRLEDAARDLAASTNAALMSAQFDFANQDLKIARLRAEELQKTAQLARSQEQMRLAISLVLGAAATVVLALVTFGFFSMRRSRNEVRAMNKELEASNAELGKALKAKTDFLASTSHEIRTPLNGILGMTEVLLADSALPASTRDRLDVVMGAGRAMRAMVDDLLDLAKAENGQVTVKRSVIDLHAVVRDAVANWQDHAQSKGLSLRVSLERAPQRIFEDADRLRQVILNLVSNAIKFTETGFVEIEVVGAVESGTLTFSVRDSGIGVAPKDQALIFESFTQVEVGLSRRFGGAGLGLAICRRIADAMGGTIRLESALGVGSTFTFQLPLQVVEDGPRQQISSGPLVGVAERLEDLRILALEPNPMAQSFLRAMVGKVAKRLDFAADYAASSDLIRESGFDRIVCDWAALGGDQDVETALARIGTMSASLPVIVLGAKAAQEFETRILAAGADAFLVKPLQPARLTSVLLERRGPDTAKLAATGVSSDADRAGAAP